MLKRSTWSSGRVVVLEHTSKVLAGNRLGDPGQFKVDYSPLLPALGGLGIQLHHLIIIRQSLGGLPSFLIDASSNVITMRIFRIGSDPKV
jgi:hypothetical protein